MRLSLTTRNHPRKMMNGSRELRRATPANNRTTTLIRVYFVHTKDVSSEVKRKLKIGRDGVDAGFIVQVGKAYTGYTSAGLWEWLAKAMQP